MTIWLKRQWVNFVFSDQNYCLGGGTLLPQLPWKREWEDWYCWDHSRIWVMVQKTDSCSAVWNKVYFIFIVLLPPLVGFDCSMEASWYNFTVHHVVVTVVTYSRTSCVIFIAAVPGTNVPLFVHTHCYYCLIPHTNLLQHPVVSYCCIIKMLLYCSGLCYLIATFILVLLCQLTDTFYGCPATILLQYSMGS